MCSWEWISSNRNYFVQVEEDGENIGDQVNPMEENDIHNIIENDRIM